MALSMLTLLQQIKNLWNASGSPVPYCFLAFASLAMYLRLSSQLARLLGGYVKNARRTAGNPVLARVIAAQTVEQPKVANTTTNPSTLDAQGNPKWRVEEATTANFAQHIQHCTKDCDGAMKIPDDFVSYNGLRAWAGKGISLSAFYAFDTLFDPILAERRITLERLILMNWGKFSESEICHETFSLQGTEVASPHVPEAPMGRLPSEIRRADKLRHRCYRQGLPCYRSDSVLKDRTHTWHPSKRLSPERAAF